VLVAQGQLAQALAAFEQSRDIRLRLAEQDPGNAVWQTDVAVSCWKLADLLRQTGDDKRAAELLREGLAVLHPLAAENRLTAQQQSWPRIFERTLAELKN
jgi:hypothetical protein